jgi:phosphatidylglycerol:prolipoprotein diacylglycerol transferase
MPFNPSYGVLMIVGLVVSAFLWSRIARPQPEMVMVYAAGLLGALVGAKAGYLLAEWPFHAHDPNLLLELLTGRTITTGLVGGYLGVELGKKLIGHRKPTGDIFAVIVPAGLFLGRIGCFLHGCCLGVACEPAWYSVRDATGVARWPASLVEAGFNLAAAAVLYALFRKGAWRGQLFHVYLIAYGAFRFGHEFLRDTPRVGQWWSPYQFIALGMVAFGVWRWRIRREEMRAFILLPLGRS